VEKAEVEAKVEEEVKAEEEDIIEEVMKIKLSLPTMILTVNVNKL
jgi:hypothetical protein